MVNPPPQGARGDQISVGLRPAWSTKLVQDIQGYIKQRSSVSKNKQTKNKQKDLFTVQFFPVSNYLWETHDSFYLILNDCILNYMQCLD